MSVNLERLKKYNNFYSNKKLSDLASDMNYTYDDMATIIAIEELSELIHATTKWLRFDRDREMNEQFYDSDRLNITEELADATIALSIIKDKAGISQDELNRMIAYKIDVKSHICRSGKMVKGSTIL